MTTNSQLSTEPKKWKQKIGKQLEKEQNQKNGHPMEGYQQGGDRGRMGEKVLGIRSIIGGHKIRRGRLRTVQGIEKPKNLHVQPMDMN